MTIDLRVQETVETTLRSFSERFEKSGASQAAIVVMATQTAQVLAIAQLETSSTTNAALIPRQSGSALKPFLYLTALSNGYTLETGIDDTPTEFHEGATLFAPRDADGQFRGRMTLAEALAQSRNVPAVRLVQAIGPLEFSRTLTAFGITPLPHPLEWYGLGIALGTAEVRLLDATGAYATLGRHCAHLSPTLHFLSREPVQVAPSENCDAVLRALSDDEARARGFGPESKLLEGEVAIKTGTSTSARDTWLFAVTPLSTIGIWAGNLDMSPQAPDVAAMLQLLPLARELIRQLHPSPRPNSVP